MFVNGATMSCLHHRVPKPLSYSLRAGALSPGHHDVGGWGPQPSFLCAGPPSTHGAQHRDGCRRQKCPGSGDMAQLPLLPTPDFSQLFSGRKHFASSFLGDSCLYFVEQIKSVLHGSVSWE